MAAHARVRTRPAPPRPRRISGPLRPAPAAAPPLRRGRGVAGGERIGREAAGVFERIRALPETRLIDGLLRGRAWIWLIGLLLGGIVAMQVSLLKLNAGISRAVTTTSTLERQNAELEAQVAKLSSVERVRVVAAANDMVTPAPGAMSFVHVRPGRDEALAARRMQPPSDQAVAVMENGGREPGVLALPTDPIPISTPAPVVTAAPVATPTPDPAVTSAVAPQG